MHQVVAGDTLIGIAIHYAVTVEDLIAADRLTDPDLLAIGQQLLIPHDRDTDQTNSNSSTANPSPTVMFPAGNETVFACEPNSRSIQLDLPADPIQLELVDSTLYLVADGKLYSIEIDELKASLFVTPDNLMPEENRVDDIHIQELVYVGHDPSNDDLLLLDKSNDIFRYTSEGAWRTEYLADQIPGFFPDPQFLAVVAGADQLFMLDADLGRVWRITEKKKAPDSHYFGLAASFGVDFTLTRDAENERFYVLNRDGSLTSIQMQAGSEPSTRTSSVSPVRWPSQVSTEGETLFIVDGEERTVTFYDLPRLDLLGTVGFRHAGMQRLRNVALDAQTIYGIAGSKLYAASLTDPNLECPAVTYDDTFYFDGADVRDLLPNIALPFSNGSLPSRPRSYPGARRLYRHGVHEGLDLYALDVPDLDIGTRVAVIADGTVTRADHDYVELSQEEYEAAVSQTGTEHRTNAALVDTFSGRQVHVDHTPQVRSRYLHLSAIEPAIMPGVRVARKAPLGAVGVSGTSAGVYETNAGVHLHFEIWIDGRYLGQGLSLYETMRLWEALFD